MANSGGGNKFVSVNLNKSYGQQPSKNHYHSHHPGSYGSNRAPTGSRAGGGGMVVLSRPRSSQKPGSKLSVPPPLNLPSLRKEHERFDSLGPGGVTASGGNSVTGPRLSSSGMGSAKPSSVARQEKEVLIGADDYVNHGVDHSLNADDDVIKVSSGGVYIPPSVRLGVAGSTSSKSPTSAISFPHLDNATVLKRDEFPSLQAALPIVSGVEKKYTNGLNQKQKQAAVENLPCVHRDASHSSSVIDRGTSGSLLLEQGRKKDDYLPGPLPLVSLNPRFDWADDERDTGHVIDHRRDHGYSKAEAYWDRDFDMPRASILPHKPAPSLFSGNLVGVVKRKKDMVKQTDFHDPVRESFEVELKRVQKMQEQERHRIIKEQERVLEHARREEEERLRFAREQAEEQRRLEEEAKESAWKAEQERLESLRRVEEQRITRAEEKRRLAMEEERRKQVAKQKLSELEEKIAKRQTEIAKGVNNFSAEADEKLLGMSKERDGLKVLNMLSRSTI